MSPPLGKAARRWLSLLLFAGLAILVALAWTAIDLHRPAVDTFLPPEPSHSLPKEGAPTIGPSQKQIQPPNNVPAQSGTGSEILQPAVTQALSGHRPAQSTVDLRTDVSVDVKFALVNGLQKLRAWSRGRVDAGQPSANQAP